MKKLKQVNVIVQSQWLCILYVLFDECEKKAFNVNGLAAWFVTLTFHSAMFVDVTV